MRQLVGGGTAPLLGRQLTTTLALWSRASRLPAAPRTQAEPLTGDTEPLTITIGKDGKVFVQETEVDPDKLVDQLLAIGENGYKQRIFVRADKAVTHGKVMEIMGRISAAGFSKVGLVTDTDTSPPSGAGKR